MKMLAFQARVGRAFPGYSSSQVLLAAHWLAGAFVRWYRE
jgi:hypothetical protein